jgi:hypothetical protein
MAYGNCNVLPVQQMGSYEGPALSDAGATLWGHVLVRINNAGLVEDHYQVRLGGSQLISASFDGSAILKPASLQGFNFTIERRPHDLVFRDNSLVSRWEDVEELVSANLLMAHHGEHQSADQRFREAWARAKTADPDLGAALRWSIQAHPTYGLKLALQGMPVSAGALRKDARLSAASASCIELFTWVVAAEMARPGQWNGPVPVLFAPDVAAAAGRLKTHSDGFAAGK